MSKFGFFLLSLVAALVAYRFVGTIPAMGLLLLIVLGAAIKRTPAKGWALVAGLSFAGIWFGSVWAFIGLLAGGPVIGAVLAICVYGCYALRQHAKRQLAKQD